MKTKILTILLMAGTSLTAFCQSYYQTYPTYPTQSSQSRSSSNSYSSPYQTNPNVRQQQGYYRSDGSYVQPHMKTESNNTNWDNYSTQGNVNPYTQQQGSRARDYSSDAYNYGQGRTIYTGERGGQYYYNSNGNKTYVPKRNPY